MEEKEESKPNKVVIFLTHILHIPQPESKAYAEELANRGYDNISTLIQNLTVDEVAPIMNKEDSERIEGFLKK
jgi:hypothetical protein